MSEVRGYQISCFLCLQLQLLCLVKVSMIVGMGHACGS